MRAAAHSNDGLVIGMHTHFPRPNVAKSYQWKAFRFFDVTEVKLSPEENAVLSEVGMLLHDF
jgi:hypothetical protein